MALEALGQSVHCKQLSFLVFLVPLGGLLVQENLLIPLVPQVQEAQGVRCRRLHLSLSQSLDLLCHLLALVFHTPLDQEDLVGLVLNHLDVQVDRVDLEALVLRTLHSQNTGLNLSFHLFSLLLLVLLGLL